MSNSNHPRQSHLWWRPAIALLSVLAVGCGGSSSSQPPPAAADNVLVFGGSDIEFGSGGIGIETLNTAEIYNTAEGEFEPTGNMADNRALFSASPLSNEDVLVAGGGQLNFSSDQIISLNSLNSAQIYNPATGQFQLIAAKLNTDRMMARANQLSGPNQVLISGGLQIDIQLGSSTASAALLNSSELFDESTQTFEVGPSMTESRILDTATTLSNGNVLLAGGITEDPTNGLSVSNTAEVYNPATKTFTATTGQMTFERAFATSNLLPNGQVLIAGGLGGPSTGATVVNSGVHLGAEATSLAGMIADLTTPSLPSFLILSSAELYNPATGQFTATGSMVDNRIGYTATTLQNGQVLIAGGLSLTIGSGSSTSNLSNLLSTLGLALPNAVLTSVNTAMLYDPTTGKFSALTAQMVADRAMPSAVLLEDGRVLITGGHSVDIDLADPNGSISYTTVNTAEIFNPATGSFTPAANMGSKRARQDSVLIPG